MKLYLAGGPIKAGNKHVLDVAVTITFAEVLAQAGSALGYDGDLREDYAVHLCERSVESGKLAPLSRELPLDLTIQASGMTAPVLMLRARHRTSASASPLTRPHLSANTLGDSQDPLNVSVTSVSSSSDFAFGGCGTGTPSAMRRAGSGRDGGPGSSGNSSFAGCGTNDQDDDGDGHTAAATSTCGSERSSYRARLHAIFKQYEPAKLDNIDPLLRKYAGREEQVIEALVRKYGPEPGVVSEVELRHATPLRNPTTPGTPTTPQSATLSRAARSSSKHRRFQLTAEEQRAMLQGPFPDRLLAIFKRFEPAKATTAHVESFLAVCPGRESEVIEALVHKYGTAEAKRLSDEAEGRAPASSDTRWPFPQQLCVPDAPGDYLNMVETHRELYENPRSSAVLGDTRGDTCVGRETRAVLRRYVRLCQRVTSECACDVDRLEKQLVWAHKFHGLASMPVSGLQKPQLWEARQKLVRSIVESFGDMSLPHIIPVYRWNPADTNSVVLLDDDGCPEGGNAALQPVEIRGQDQSEPRRQQERQISELPESGWTFFRPADGVMAHVWSDGGAARRLVKSVDTLWEALLEYRIGNLGFVRAPIVVQMGYIGHTVTLMPVVPLQPGDPPRMYRQPFAMNHRGDELDAVVELLSRSIHGECTAAAAAAAAAANSNRQGAAASTIPRVASLSSTRSSFQQDDSEGEGVAAPALFPDTEDPGTIYAFGSCENCVYLFTCKAQHVCLDDKGTVFARLRCLPLLVAADGRTVGPCAVASGAYSSPLVPPQTALNRKLRVLDAASLRALLATNVVPLACLALVDDLEAAILRGDAGRDPSRFLLEQLQAGLVPRHMHAVGINMRFLAMLDEGVLRIAATAVETRMTACKIASKLIEMELVSRAVKAIVTATVRLHSAGVDADAGVRATAIVSMCMNNVSSFWQDVQAVIRRKFFSADVLTLVQVAHTKTIHANVIFGRVAYLTLQHKCGAPPDIHAKRIPLLRWALNSCASMHPPEMVKLAITDQAPGTLEQSRREWAAAVIKRGGVLLRPEQSSGADGSGAPPLSSSSSSPRGSHPTLTGRSANGSNKGEEDPSGSSGAALSTSTHKNLLMRLVQAATTCSAARRSQPHHTAVLEEHFAAVSPVLPAAMRHVVVAILFDVINNGAAGDAAKGKSSAAFRGVVQQLIANANANADADADASDGDVGAAAGGATAPQGTFFDPFITFPIVCRARITILFALQSTLALVRLCGTLADIELFGYMCPPPTTSAASCGGATSSCLLMRVAPAKPVEAFYASNGLCRGSIDVLTRLHADTSLRLQLTTATLLRVLRVGSLAVAEPAISAGHAAQQRAEKVLGFLLAALAATCRTIADPSSDSDSDSSLLRGCGFFLVSEHLSALVVSMGVWRRQCQRLRQLLGVAGGTTTTTATAGAVVLAEEADSTEVALPAALLGRCAGFSACACFFAAAAAAAVVVEPAQHERERSVAAVLAGLTGISNLASALGSIAAAKLAEHLDRTLGSPAFLEALDVAAAELLLRRILRSAASGAPGDLAAAAAAAAAAVSAALAAAPLILAPARARAVAWNLEKGALWAPYARILRLAAELPERVRVRSLRRYIALVAQRRPQRPPPRSFPVLRPTSVTFATIARALQREAFGERYRAGELCVSLRLVGFARQLIEGLETLTRGEQLILAWESQWSALAASHQLQCCECAARQVGLVEAEKGVRAGLVAQLVRGRVDAAMEDVRRGEGEARRECELAEASEWQRTVREAVADMQRAFDVSSARVAKKEAMEQLIASEVSARSHSVADGEARGRARLVAAGALQLQELAARRHIAENVEQSQWMALEEAVAALHRELRARCQAVRELLAHEDALRGNCAADEVAERAVWWAAATQSAADAERSAQLRELQVAEAAHRAAIEGVEEPEGASAQLEWWWAAVDAARAMVEQRCAAVLSALQHEEACVFRCEVEQAEREARDALLEASAAAVREDHCLQARRALEKVEGDEAAAREALGTKNEERRRQELRKAEVESRLQLGGELARAAHSAARRVELEQLEEAARAALVQEWARNVILTLGAELESGGRELHNKTARAAAERAETAARNTIGQERDAAVEALFFPALQLLQQRLRVEDPEAEARKTLLARLTTQSIELQQSIQLVVEEALARESFTTHLLVEQWQATIALPGERLRLEVVEESERRAIDDAFTQAAARLAAKESVLCCEALAREELWSGFVAAFCAMREQLISHVAGVAAAGLFAAQSCARAGIISEEAAKREAVEHEWMCDALEAEEQIARVGLGLAAQVGVEVLHLGVVAEPRARHRVSLDENRQRASAAGALASAVSEFALGQRARVKGAERQCRAAIDAAADQERSRLERSYRKVLRAAAALLEGQAQERAACEEEEARARQQNVNAANRALAGLRTREAEQRSAVKKLRPRRPTLAPVADPVSVAELTQECPGQHSGGASSSAVNHPPDDQGEPTPQLQRQMEVAPMAQGAPPVLGTAAAAVASDDPPRAQPCSRALALIAAAAAAAAAAAGGHEASAVPPPLALMLVLSADGGGGGGGGARATATPADVAQCDVSPKVAQGSPGAQRHHAAPAWRGNVISTPNTMKRRIERIPYFEACVNVERAKIACVLEAWRGGSASSPVPPLPPPPPEEEETAAAATLAAAARAVRASPAGPIHGRHALHRVDSVGTTAVAATPPPLLHERRQPFAFSNVTELLREIEEERRRARSGSSPLRGGDSVALVAPIPRVATEPPHATVAVAAMSVNKKKDKKAGGKGQGTAEGKKHARTHREKRGEAAQKTARSMSPGSDPGTLLGAAPCASLQGAVTALRHHWTRRDADQPSGGAGAALAALPNTVLLPPVRDEGRQHRGSQQHHLSAVRHKGQLSFSKILESGIGPGKLPRTQAVLRGVNKRRGVPEATTRSGAVSAPLIGPPPPPPSASLHTSLAQVHTDSPQLPPIVAATRRPKSITMQAACLRGSGMYAERQKYRCLPRLAECIAELEALHDRDAAHEAEAQRRETQQKLRRFRCETLWRLKQRDAETDDLINETLHAIEATKMLSLR